MHRSLMFITRVATSVGLLYFGLSGINFATIQSRLSYINPLWIALAIAVAIFQIFIGAPRWCEISALCQAPLGNLQALRYNIIGGFFNQTLPSSIGGDAVRLWLVKCTGAGWRAATYSILIDRVVGLLALAFIIIASLPWSYAMIGDADGRRTLILINLATLGGGAGFLLVGHLHCAWVKRLWPIIHVRACSAIANQVIFSKSNGPKIAVLSLTIHALTVVIAWCCARAVDAPSDFARLLMLTPPIILITMIPLSIAGWGLREAATMVAFGYAGLAPSDGAVISILFGAVYFIVGALGGLVWIFSAENRSGYIQAAPPTKD
ncbi:lysylphosphatidylglycerol synthase transmembrane domain-containing protein [Bradyrhizobium ivorense]|uniref:lysylphosphatidylglycerol synthase transmembrane domain-containing protein n=1 Tax=Bradyrhizobium ivorense TaxID=2511166 RepID=UPI001116EC14|nr:lysylphosphatidylglycerol synthase transmembrane domain-containing protein [Bradyrhizobium ivorense]